MKLIQVLVRGKDVTATLDLSVGVDWTEAIRAYLADENEDDAKTVQARHARLDGGSPNGTHERYEVFAGQCTPPGGGEGERWVGRNYWADLYYDEGENEPADD